MTTNPEPDHHLLAIETDRTSYLATNEKVAVEIYDEALLSLQALHIQRKSAATDFSTYHLPQLPDKDRDEIFERVLETERQLVAPRFVENDYKNGTADFDNELLNLFGSKLLLTAEHATEQRRLNGDGLRKPKEADYGTAGLSKVVQEETGASIILPLGRQTGDANTDEVHPLKEAMFEHFSHGTNAHFSIHGMGRALVASLIDERNFAVMLGVGPKPNDTTKDAVDKMQEIASNYDLRLGVNQPFIQFEPDAPARPKRNADGSLKTISFSAIGKGTTRAFTQLTAPEATAVQIELADVLRVMPSDFKRHPGQESQRIGVYLGYLFLKDCVNVLGVQRDR